VKRWGNGIFPPASAKPVAFVTTLREKPLQTHMVGLRVLFLFLFAPFLLAAKNVTPTPVPAGPMIIITPNQGSPSAFELVRVEPDRVEVSKEGVRLQFARHQIRQIRVPEAGDLVLEAVGVLSRIETEDISTFDTLIPSLEAKLPALSNLANRFGWLIPDASPTLITVKQAVTDMRGTLQATQNLQETGKRVEAMANGSIPLSASWEEQINLALAETNRIPYMKIRKETLDRFLSIRRKIRLDLTQANQEATARARSLLEDLYSELQAGTLTEAGSQLLIKETRRYVERVLEPTERTNLDSQLVKATDMAQNWFSARVIRESAQAAQGALSTVQADISATSPSVHLESVLPRIYQIRRLVADVPESTTKEAITAQLNTFESSLRNLPPPTDGGRTLPVGIGANTVPTSPSVRQPTQVSKLDDTQALIQRSLTNWRLWVGVSLFLFLLNLRKRKAPTITSNQTDLPSRMDHGSSDVVGSSVSSRKSLNTPVPAFPDLVSKKGSSSWREGVEDPLQPPHGPSDDLDLDAYGRIKKKRNTQG
jgi:hypothetical protein